MWDSRIGMDELFPFQFTIVILLREELILAWRWLIKITDWESAASMTNWIHRTRNNDELHGCKVWDTLVDDSNIRNYIKWLLYLYFVHMCSEKLHSFVQTILTFTSSDARILIWRLEVYRSVESPIKCCWIRIHPDPALSHLLGFQIL